MKTAILLPILCLSSLALGAPERTADSPSVDPSQNKDLKVEQELTLKESQDQSQNPDAQDRDKRHLPYRNFPGNYYTYSYTYPTTYYQHSWPYQYQSPYQVPYQYQKYQYAPLYYPGYNSHFYNPWYATQWR